MDDVNSPAKMASPDRANKTSRTARDQQAPQGDRTIQYAGRDPQGSGSGPTPQQTVQDPQSSDRNPPGRQADQAPQGPGSGLPGQETGQRPQASGRVLAQLDDGRDPQGSGIEVTQQQTGRASLQHVVPEQRANPVARRLQMRPGDLPQQAASSTGGKAGPSVRDSRASQGGPSQRAAGPAGGRAGSPAQGTQGPGSPAPHQAAGSPAGRKSSPPARDARADQSSQPQRTAGSAGGRQDSPAQASQIRRSAVSQRLTESSPRPFQPGVGSPRAGQRKHDSTPAIAPALGGERKRKVRHERDAGIFHVVVMVITSIWIAPKSPNPKQQSPIALEELGARYNEQVAAPRGWPKMEVGDVSGDNVWTLEEFDGQTSNAALDLPDKLSEPNPGLK